MPCVSEAPQLLSAHPWTPPERLSQQTGTCSPTFPPTRNTQFPFSDSDKTTPLPRKSLLVLLNRKASLITSQSWSPLNPHHPHTTATFTSWLPSHRPRSRMLPAMPVLLSLASLCLSQPTCSCPLQETGPEQMFHPGTQTWPCKTESTPRSTQVRRFTEAAYPSAQLRGLQEHLLLPTAFFFPSRMHCSHLLVSGLTRSKSGGLISPPSPWFLVSMRSAQLISSLYMLLLFRVGFFSPGLTFSKLSYFLKLWLLHWLLWRCYSPVVSVG